MNNEDKIIELLLELKRDVKTINERTARIEDDYGRKINGLYESVVGTGEKFTRLDDVENRVNNHEGRIFAVEQILKAK